MHYLLTLLALPGVIIHTLDQPQPVYCVQLPGEGAVPGIAEVAQLEAVLPLYIHVAPVGRSGLPVQAEVILEPCSYLHLHQP